MDNHLLDDQFAEKENFNTEELNLILKARNEANDMVGDIRSARMMLFILAGLSGLGIVFILSQSSGFNSITTFSAAIVGIYLFLAIVVPKNPAVILSIASALYILLLIVNFASSPSIGIGIIMRILVIYFLGKGLQSAFKLPKKLRELQQLGVPTYWIEQAENLQDLPTTRDLKQ